MRIKIFSFFILALLFISCDEESNCLNCITERITYENDIEVRRLQNLNTIACEENKDLVINNNYILIQEDSSSFGTLLVTHIIYTDCH